MSGFKPFLAWCCLFSVTALLGAAVMAQKRTTGALRAERDLLTAVIAAAPVAGEAGNPAPAPGPASIAAPVALAHDEFDRAAIHRLQTEIVQLRARVTARERALREFAVVQAAAKRAKRSITEGTLPYAEWANAGRATPESTLETALWAGAGGDVRAFDELLTFDDEAAAAARKLFNRLPGDIQAEYERPERIIALLTAADVPLTAAQVCGVFKDGTDQRILIARLTEADQSSRLIQFRTRVDGEDGTWRIVVPRAAVDAYAARLAGTSTDP